MITINGETYLNCDEVAARLNKVIVKNWSGSDARSWGQRMDVDQKGDLIGFHRDPESDQIFFKQSAIEAMIDEFENIPGR